MNELWRPRSVAVVGSGSLSERVVSYLRQHGYAGSIYEVDPRDPNVDATIDLALILVGAARVPQALRDCGAWGARYAVIFASGFGETGEAGRAMEAEALAAARAAGVRLVGPNCIGLVSPADRLVAGFSPLFAGVTFESGNLGLVAQSGALGYGLASLAVERGLAFSRIINTGNEADVDAAEIITDLLEHDDATDAVLVYCEGLKRPHQWRELAALSRARRKPVVVLKAGRSAAGARAAASHTAALTGEDAVWDAAFRQLGLLRAADLDEMLDLAALFAARPPQPAGGRVGVLTTSGGAGILAADAIADQTGGDAAAPTLTLPEITGATRTQLDAIIPAFGSAANPVDVTAQVISDSHLFRRALKAMATDPGLDLLLVCFCVLQGEEAERIAADLLAVQSETTRPILVSRTGAEFLAPGVSARLTKAGIPVFATPGRAVRAAAALVRFTEARVPEPQQTETELKIPLPQQTLATSPTAAVAAAEAIGYPVVLKLPTQAHKTELGGVRLNLHTAAQVKAAYEAVNRGQGCMVQEQVTGAVAELLAGVAPTPMGPMVTVGLGGIFVETLNDLSRRLAPITEAEAHDMLRELRGFPILAGARGRPPGDLDAAAQLIAHLSRWAAAHPNTELDLNPVMLLPAGQGCKVVDIRLIERGEPHGSDA